MTTVSLGDRMKAYEGISQIHLTPRTPMILRIDGRAFHTYTKDFEKPWSAVIKTALTDASEALLAEISGAKVAYCQSDEISILVTDYDSHDTTPWFDKNVQKICSVVASIATGFFNDSIHGQIDMQSSGQRKGVPRLAMFDARCFVMPREDVNNYFVWRQRDATRNSIAMLAQSHFSPSQLHGKNGNQMQEMLFSSKGINWNDIETWKRRGWCAWRESYESAPQVIRTRLVEDVVIPIFSADPSYIEGFVDIDEQTTDAPSNEDSDPTEGNRS